MPRARQKDRGQRQQERGYPHEAAVLGVTDAQVVAVGRIAESVGAKQSDKLDGLERALAVELEARLRGRAAAAR